MSSVLPQKKHYRQRPHSSQLIDRNIRVPLRPDDLDLDEFFPNNINIEQKQIQIVDIGCGYGGLLFELSKLFPNTLSVGLEIRDKVYQFVLQKIQALRLINECNNVWVVRTNAMKYYHNYFAKNQLQKIFVLFPDPHFKPSKHRERIIRKSMLDEYAYTLKIGGKFYVATDVKTYFDYAKQEFDMHPLFDICNEDELKDDIIYNKLDTVTDEGKNVTREGGTIYKCCYKRIQCTSNDDSITKFPTH